MQERNDFDPKAYSPTFRWGFLAPKYWGTWLAIIFALPFSLLPKSIHVKAACFVARWLAKKRQGTVLNIWVNLSLCFPHKSDEEKEQILTECLTTAGTFFLSFPLITLFGRRYLEKNTEIKGLEHLDAVRRHGDNIILLAPHTWAIDIIPVLLASKSQPVVAMVKQQKNPIGDWLMHRQRMQFGGRIYERSAGIKPYMKSIREGYIGYYLPDQDHGREQSVFVNFFGVKKATLPGLGKLAKVSRAKIVPSFTRFNLQTGKYEVTIYPAWDNFPTGEELTDARCLNKYIEEQISQYPEQYMWIFQLLRHRPDPNEPSPYRDKKYQKKVRK
ncbi:lauroyl-Kdo(2)-lipid IV(A) myristoyltransferase [Vibrio sp. HA2012]|uniref:lauroyl-Kdo(2)-lipid IV(A) myristoyltransferase n=1 Tax=Vibrio sp. HA2012 TaxID=1971595 RepID=UPI000C2B5F79|nr:lauroyl-Kdo(2)-lipid IV(A) myristoyltransferase [Vibrio sp. HA2012]PJC85232.1 lauroyl-Kdo(2)-lipid IV(A) myristoyltransferase [Vibrio sp. HA2012]